MFTHLSYIYHGLYPHMNIYTALMIAARLGYSDVVRVLLRNDASVDIADPKGNTALHLSFAPTVRSIIIMIVLLLVLFNFHHVLFPCMNISSAIVVMILYSIHFRRLCFTMRLRTVWRRDLPFVKILHSFIIYLLFMKSSSKTTRRILRASRAFINVANNHGQTLVLIMS